MKQCVFGWGFFESNLRWRREVREEEGERFVNFL